MKQSKEQIEAYRAMAQNAPQSMNDIIKQLNGIEGGREYWFHTMTAEQVHQRIKLELVKASSQLAQEDSVESLELAKIGFAKVSAMCMIAMDYADLKKALILEKHTHGGAKDVQQYK